LEVLVLRNTDGVKMQKSDDSYKT